VELYQGEPELVVDCADDVVVVG